VPFVHSKEQHWLLGPLGEHGLPAPKHEPVRDWQVPAPPSFTLHWPLQQSALCPQAPAVGLSGTQAVP
jgi:hypothetical protein